MKFRCRLACLTLALASWGVAPGCSFSQGQSPSPAPAPAGAPVAPSAPSESTPKPQEKAPTPPAPAAVTKAPETPPPPKAFKPLTPECTQLFQQIQELEKGIPIRFNNLKRPAEEIYRDMLACMDLSRRFLTLCSGTEPECEVKAILARVQLASLSRYQEDLRREKALTEADRARKVEERQQESLMLAEAAASADCSTRVRINALQTCVDLYEKLFLFEKMRAGVEQIFKLDPAYPGHALLYLSVGQSYLAERRYVDAVKYLREVIKTHTDEPEYVLYMDKLLDALTGAGDLEGMEELMYIVLSEYPTRIPLLPEDHELRGQYEQWTCVAPFWIGFVRMALGDNDAAREWFKKQITSANEHAKALSDKGKGVQHDVCRIFSDFRSQDMLYWLDKFYGKAPQCELDLGELWATEEQITLKESAGKVLPILFRMPESRRAESFLQGLDSLVKSRSKDGLAGATIGYVTGTPNAAQDAMLLQKMRDDLKRLGVSLPAGFDPDRTKHKIFSELHGTVGTASFAVLDRNGKMAWFLADPRDMDREIARRVIERLLSQKP